jgi:group I intron endonuclease
MGIIYKITHKETSKCYIGQTKMSLEWRLNNKWCGHFTRATSDCGKSYISNAIYKYGKEAFTYEIIEECDNDKLNEREIYWISFYNSFNDGYNQTTGGNSTISLKGRKMTW